VPVVVDHTRRLLHPPFRAEQQRPFRATGSSSGFRINEILPCYFDTLRKLRWKNEPQRTAQRCSISTSIRTKPAGTQSKRSRTRAKDKPITYPEKARPLDQKPHYSPTTIPINSSFILRQSNVGDLFPRSMILGLQESDPLDLDMGRLASLSVASPT
jgi:hypothetical protein